MKISSPDFVRNITFSLNIGYFIPAQSSLVMTKITKTKYYFVI